MTRSAPIASTIYSKERDSQNIPAQPSDRVCWFIVGGLTLLAGVLRFWKLGDASLWGDEINFVNWSFPKETFKSFLENYPRFHMAEGYPSQLPLPLLIQHYVMKLGSSDFLTRVPAAIFGTLTIPIMFILGRRLFDNMTGITASALGAISFFHIYYSREAYFYSPAVFFCCWFFAALRCQHRLVINGERCKKSVLFWLWFSGAAALLCHLTTVFFVAAVGIATAAEVVIASRTTAPQQRSSLMRRAWPLFIVYALCWMPVFPFLWHNLHNQFRAIFIAPHQAVPNIVKLPLQMGWGSIWWAELLFLACFVAGVFGGVLRKDFRSGSILCVWVVVSVVGLYIAFSGILFYAPRYLILILVPALLIVAFGMKLLASWVACRIRRPLLCFPFVVIGLMWLGLASIYPLKQLYSLTGKPTDWRGIASWMKDNLPQGTIVFFDWDVVVWQMVPTYYQVPGIHCTYTIPLGNPEDMLRHNYRERTQATLENFSDTAYLEAMRLNDWHSHLGGRWKWPEQYFRSHKSFRNEAVLELDKLGLWPVGFDKQILGEVDPILYYNTREDIIAIHKERGIRVFRRFGQGFGYAKTPDYHDWRTISDQATVELYNLSQAPLRVRLQLRGAGLPQANGRVGAVMLSARVNEKIVGEFTLSQSKLSQASIDLTLPTGRTDVKLTILSADSGAQTIRILVDELTVTVYE